MKSKLIPGTALMELETTTVWATVEDHPSYGLKIFLKNITAKKVIKLFLFGIMIELYLLEELCKIALMAPEVIRNATFKWPLNTIVNVTEMYPINGFDYMKARVKKNNPFSI